MVNPSDVVVIVIPVYKMELSYFEKISYLQCLRILKNFPICLVAPESLDLTSYTNLANVSIERFSLAYFNDINGYNKLLLSPLFYRRFSNFQYILIYQLDCYIFKDELKSWCSRNYDYVGAPWIKVNWLHLTCKIISKSILKRQKTFTRLITRVKWKIYGLNIPVNLNVGNGGFSLRKVETFYKVTKAFQERISDWPYNEDYFWAIFVPLSGFELHKPSWQEAAYFSFDINPQICFDVTNKTLPFGCHAWYRNDHPYDNFKFWDPIINDNLDKVIVES